MRFAAPSLAAFIAALALLAACGEKDEPATTGPVVSAETTTSTTAPPGIEESQRALQVVTDFLSSPDAARVCDTQVTERFLRMSYGDRSGCIAARKPASLARGAQIDGPNIEGATATASARPTGGAFDGQQLDLELILQAGQWRIDTLTSSAPGGP